MNLLGNDSIFKATTVSYIFRPLFNWCLGFKICSLLLMVTLLINNNNNKGGKIYTACVQTVLTYGTETWTIKKANLQSLERTERMMMRRMCQVSLKDRKRNVDL